MTNKKEGIKVSISRLSMSMDPQEYYNSEEMRLKFQNIRKFKRKVIDERNKEVSTAN